MTDETCTDENCPDKTWDAKCNQCGKCCFEKLEDGRGKIIYTQNACRYLDIITRNCKIFDRRFEINPHCIKLTPELLPHLHWLPSDCGYKAPVIKFNRKEKRRR